MKSDKIRADYEFKIQIYSGQIISGSATRFGE
jgi:hypothetical protein